MIKRDLTKRQFKAACERYGFRPGGFLGYYRITENTSVSVLNAGDRLRDRLAYLIAARDKAKINASAK
jgi:hypothetical protein